MVSRYYDPEVGRFVSTDTIAEGGNLYAYCQCDPVNRADESGSFSFKKMFSATNLAIIGIVAVATAISVLSCGAAAPIMAVAVVTLVAGVGTLAFAAAEAQEAITDDQNYLRDSVFQGNQEAYNITMATVSTTAMIGTMIIAPYAGKCFIAGTGVLTANGAMAIEDIEIGMLVYAYDDATGEVALKPVVQLFRNETYELTKVSTSDGQVIVSTPGHPYYTVNRGWIHASDLRAGDILLLVNGQIVVVEWVQHEIPEAPVKIEYNNVCNFTESN